MADKLLKVLFNGGEPHKPDYYPYSGMKVEGLLTYFNLPVYDNPIGIEIEAEKYVGQKTPMSCWNVTDDGSLRDNGVEWVTYPLYREYIDYALWEIEREFTAQPQMTFSHRCSIHVHVNVSEFTVNQLYALIALYALYEKSLFEFVDPIRKGNSFCYPIVGTNSLFNWDMNTKYCAFNWTPIKKQLTVEYRHLEGTKDWKKVRRWIALVTKLTNFVGAIPANKAIETIETVIFKNEGVQFARNVFGNTAVLLNNLTLSVEEGSMWAATFLERNK
jgi:hypothetical protein